MRPEGRAADGAPLAAGLRGVVTVGQREALLGQQGAVVWLTGLSGSGKSSLARALEAALLAEGYLVAVLDGDVLRQGLNSDMGFAPTDRAENIRRVGELATLLADHGLLVITAFVSPYAVDRLQACTRVGAQRFFEVHLAASVRQCAARDPKGLYALAAAGELPGFTSVSAPYEAPEEPALRLETGREPLVASVAALRRALAKAGLVPGRRGALDPPNEDCR